MEAGAEKGQIQNDSVLQEPRGVELALDENQLDEEQTSDEHDDAEVEEEDVEVEVMTGGGDTHMFTLPPTATVLLLKREVERDAGFPPARVKLYVHGDSREEELEEGETLGSLRRGKGQKILITIVVEEADAQEVVPRLAADANGQLGPEGDGPEGDDDVQPGAGLAQPFSNIQPAMPGGVAFVPAFPDWAVTTEHNRIKISNFRTGALICEFGQFTKPGGVAVTSDSSLVIIADHDNHRMKVLRLVAAADGSSAHLEFVHHISKAFRSSHQLVHPTGVALLPGEGGGQETVLVTEYASHRVSQFTLDGTFIRIFAGAAPRCSGDGEFHSPYDITVLGSSGEVAVADKCNHRVQIFDYDGNYKRQFGSEGEEGEVADGQFRHPSALASDVHGNLLVLDFTNRLQVFDPKGKHLCTRNDLNLVVPNLEGYVKGIAWSAAGELAVANYDRNSVLVWY
jgi:DNA-binding beta-propeller fold protein YncE